MNDSIIVNHSFSMSYFQLFFFDTHEIFRASLNLTNWHKSSLDKEFSSLFKLMVMPLLALALIAHAFAFSCKMP